MLSAPSLAVLFLNGRNVEGQAQPAAAAGGLSAVPNAVGTQDVTGPYEVVKGRPKDISTLPGNRKWTCQGNIIETWKQWDKLFPSSLHVLYIGQDRDVRPSIAGGRRQVAGGGRLLPPAHCPRPT